MDFSKITLGHVWGVGIALIVISCGLVYGLFVRNVQADAASAKTYADAQKAKADTLPDVQKQDRDAERDLTTATVQNGEFYRRNPKWQLGVTPQERWDALDQQQKEILGAPGHPSMGVILTRFLTRHQTDLDTTAAVQFSMPAVTPSEVFKASPIVYPNAGTIAISGTYGAIERYIASLSNAPRLLVLHDLALDATQASTTTIPGRDNWVNAGVSFDVYEFIPGAQPAAGAATGGAGGGGMMGGGMGGGMGGYPGGGGGAGMSTGGAPGGYPGGGGGATPAAAAPAGGAAGGASPPGGGPAQASA